MSEWSIDPDRVNGVLAETAEHLGEEGGSGGMLGHMNTISTTVESLSDTADSLPISIALGEFCGHYFDVMGGMVAKTSSGLTGASDATTAYVNGDLEMAAEAQSEAGKVPTEYHDDNVSLM
ncbi:DUF6507 family protein [Nocardiopsis sp. MG754419]|uniref:DUF6507 family protein n=1 Tax=Nocardiopsis sp. MG754419 TaxID=2259865 RepID=UPI001BAB4BCF|nr:DUF6507 family protein [Nocardiopsis sp. MG754419]MBR8744832.1 hypothetical protein [Nocardiopsis sp. MG754419]